MRSPAVHHPDPNPHALRTFAERRYPELHSPYDRPGTRLFQEFCATVIQHWQLQDYVTPAQVTQLQPLGGKPCRFRLGLDTGDTVLARRVVLATGGGQPYVPGWVHQVDSAYPVERLCHGSQVKLPTLPSLKGETVLIVGSGLTSGHLAVGAMQRGARVVMMARRTFQEKLFDADPGWLGPKYLNELFLMGPWAALQVGPVARNLFGGKLASDRIVPALTFPPRQTQRHPGLISNGGALCSAIK